MITAGNTTLSDGFEAKAPAGIRRTAKIERVSSVRTSGYLSVSLQEAERYIRTNLYHRTDLLERLLQAVPAFEEDYGLALLTQAVTVDLAGPAWRARLPRRPFASLTSVAEIASGSSSTLSTSSFHVRGYNHPLLLSTGGNVVAAGGDYVVRVVYAAGFGANFRSVPLNIRNAFYLYVAERFNIRTTQITGRLTASTPVTVESYLGAWNPIPNV